MIPKIRIGAITYQVRELDDLHTVHEGDKKVALNGHILYNSAEIRVANELAADVKTVCVWHEALHGILNNAGQNDHPEPLIEALSYGLVQMIRDNPELIELTVHGTTPTEYPTTG